MNTKTELEVAEESDLEALQKSDAVELSLSDLDMVGGGTPGMIWG